MNLTGTWVNTRQGYIYEIIRDREDDNYVVGRRVLLAFSKVCLGKLHEFIARSDILDDEFSYQNSVKRAIMEEKTVSNNSEREIYKNLETYCNRQR